ncbi:MAG: 2-keto-4-pentenoate hydratase [Nocardioidaceae bacterium]
MTSTDPISEAADLLWNTWQAGTTVAALPADIRPQDQQQAMAIQRSVSGRIGATFGWKVGATAPASQAFLGVDAPLAGALHERFRLEDGEPMSLSGQLMRLAEPEFAFRMATDVDGSASLDDVIAAVDSMHLAIEVPDSRYDSFDGVDGLQILADGVCTGSFLLGPGIDGWADLDLADQAVALHVNGDHVADGSGATVLGDPRKSLHWLASELPRFGLALRAGDIVTTGTAAPPAPVAPGDTVVAEFPGLGSVAMSFTE